jgi:heat shock protein HtpX
MAAYGLYTHIASNRRRSVLLLAGLFLLVYVMVFAGALIGEAMSDPGQTVGAYLTAAGRDLLWAAPVATAGAALWVAIAWRFNGKLIDLVTGAHGVTRQEQPGLYNLLENLCISRGIAKPKLKVLETDALNAYASGLNDRQYSITVTRGLLNALTDHEIEAVLGHELTHIRNGDVRMMVIAVVIAGVVGFFAELFFRMVFTGGWRGGRGSSSGDSRKGGGGAILAILIAAVLIALAWLLSQVIRFSLSRSREYLADAGSVELTKNPDAMISALRKIEGRGELAAATSSVMELCVDNPRDGFADLFATHPAIDKRITALVQFAGGHDPGPLALPPRDDGATGGTDADTPSADAGPWGLHPDDPRLGQLPPKYRDAFRQWQKQFPNGPWGMR